MIFHLKNPYFKELQNIKISRTQSRLSRKFNYISLFDYFKKLISLFNKLIIDVLLFYNQIMTLSQFVIKLNATYHSKPATLCHDQSDLATVP